MLEVIRTAAKVLSLGREGLDPTRSNYPNLTATALAPPFCDALSRSHAARPYAALTLTRRTHASRRQSQPVRTHTRTPASASPWVARSHACCVIVHPKQQKHTHRLHFLHKTSIPRRLCNTLVHPCLFLFSASSILVFSPARLPSRQAHQVISLWVKHFRSPLLRRCVAPTDDLTSPSVLTSCYPQHTSFGEDDTLAYAISEMQGWRISEFVINPAANWRFIHADL